jgi:5-methylcytosine-specific restriction protein B
MYKKQSGSDLPHVNPGELASDRSATPPRLVTPRPDLRAVAEDFGRALTDAGVTFGSRHDDVVRSFVASLATKRFVILTGLSGSGKTQIALRFGEWLGRKELVAVRPDWTGAESVFGYEDVLRAPDEGGRSWHVPAALEFMLSAARDPDRPYLLILDEMNLAHVERYLADLLSGMESQEPCLPNLVKTKTDWKVEMGGDERICIPPNLFLVGTVNVDETTYMFSPKVLDRANTIEFRVATDELVVGGRRPRSCSAGSDDLVLGFLSIARDDGWQDNHPASGLSLFTEKLRLLHRLLAADGFEFGHRVFFEAIRFASLFAAAGNSEVHDALDYQVLQKVLPRLHGSRKRLEPVLCALGRFCLDLGFEDRASRGATRFDPESADLPPALLPRSFEKVRRMTAKLRANQFTSFTE